MVLIHGGLQWHHMARALEQHSVLSVKHIAEGCGLFCRQNDIHQTGGLFELPIVVQFHNWRHILIMVGPNSKFRQVIDAMSKLV